MTDNMTDTMTDTTAIVYEHPLNEKIRTYLRLEFLFQQVHCQLALADENQQQSFFTNLFALIEVMDRNDVRPDLIKDIERCESQLVIWSQHPSVSDTKLQTMLQAAVRMQSELLRSGKLLGALKDDNFLAPLRQRFSIPGGCCYFDMPQLQYWFSLPLAERQAQAEDWLNQVSLAEQAIRYVLSFIRERGHYQDVLADNGFYQQNAEQYELLRIKYPAGEGTYPTVSGNKYRYAIRFMQLDADSARSAAAKTQQFQLACC
ncbi:cell division protein ZapD [Arsukibacterium sp.]|uniref:cell division protein ZapD n=1 Tax=Arsukibacterium sp. TaxID=1977258 RepID=UPI00299E8213|nr:cell division protein ZapD [Arsukibacterium sp.]MDX1537685.1 cell division protein ZapD [Arsukibacterium sp.]